MTFQDYNRKYDEEWHRYPVYAQEFSTEGAFKRYQSMPGPKEVFDYALAGLPKFLPLTGEQITPQGFVNQVGAITTALSVEDFLASAITEIEMAMDCNLSEVVHFHTEDLIDGMPQNNFYGIRLQRWPATSVVKMTLKYPHATNPDDQLYAEYTIPRSWVSLRRNKVNVVASIGSVSVEFGSPSAFTAGGLFTYISGFYRGAYQPNAIEVVYKAGFEHDKLPAVVSDLVKTWAAHRYLVDVAPVLFPNSSVTVSIDGISQSVGYDIQRLVTERVASLEKKKNELKRTFTKQFGQTVGMSFIGT